VFIAWILCYIRTCLNLTSPQLVCVRCSVKEACNLLTLSAGSVLLLKDILHKALHDPDAASDQSLLTDPVAALHDIGVYKLTPTDAELVLSLRT